MLTNQPRCIFQIDGKNGGVLNVAERPLDEGQVLLVISNGESEAKISLSEEAFLQLSDLRYSLRFKPQDVAQVEPLRAVA